MIKYYLVGFAKPVTNWTEVEKYLIEAVEYARCNLLMRYGIKIHWVSFQRDFVIVADMPSDANFQNPGSRLSGISRYLLKHHKDIFKKYKVGTRLLWYAEILPGSPILKFSKEATNG